jgi:hypothetical protein
MAAVHRSRTLRLTAQEMAVACFAVIVVFAIGVGMNARRSDAGAWTIGGDFVEFYTAGRILNDHQGDRLYDLALQEQIHRELVPGETSLRLPFLYAPFVAAPFRPLALLSHRQALIAFLIITPLLYGGALALLNVQFGPRGRGEQMLLLLAGLSFFPFLGYNWLGAQISVIGFTAIALALVAEDRGRPVLSGLALSLCLYKPSLLLLILPMLVVSGRVRHVQGFVAGAGLLTVASMWIAGRHSTLEFVVSLAGVLRQSTTSVDLYNPYRYVDLNAFFRLLPYGRSPGGYVLLGILSIAVAAALLNVWWRSRGAGRPQRLLAWAATLTWTLVLNVYTPFYDSILVVAAAILAVAGVRSRGWRGWNRLAPLLLAVYLTPWVAEASARTIRVQLFTVILGSLGTVLVLESRIRREEDDILRSMS